MKISVKWIGGATWIMKAGPLTIACDPVLCPAGTVQDYRYFKTRRLNDPLYDVSDFSGIDLWLLTHEHEDHIDSEGAEKISAESVIVAHRGLRRLLEKRGLHGCRLLAWGEETRAEFGPLSVTVRAVPAVHAAVPGLGRYIGNGNGYVLKISDNTGALTLYVTGDSVFKKRRIRGVIPEKIDIVIANAGAARVGTGLLGKLIGRITNGSRDICRMAAFFKPKAVIPVHWGTFSHYMEIFPDNINAGTVRRMNPGDVMEIVTEGPS